MFTLVAEKLKQYSREWFCYWTKYCETRVGRARQAHWFAETRDRKSKHVSYTKPLFTFEFEFLNIFREIGELNKLVLNKDDVVKGCQEQLATHLEQEYSKVKVSIGSF